MRNQKMTGGLLTHEVSNTGAVFGRKNDVRVIFQGSDACTDGNRIILPALASEKEVDAKTQRILRGFLDHEAGHIRHSDMPLIMKTYERWAKEDKKHHKHLHNALEDIWLERRVLAEYPGAAENLKATATFANEGALEAIKSGKVSADKLNDPAAMTAIGITWRGRQDYGGSTTHELWDHLGDDVKRKIDDAIAALDACDNTGDIINLATKIADEIFEEHKRPPEDDEDEGEPDDDGDDESAGESAGDDDSFDGDDGADDDSFDGDTESDGDPSDGEASGEGESKLDDIDAGKTKSSGTNDDGPCPIADPVEGFDAREAIEKALKEAKLTGVTSDYRALSTVNDRWYDVASPKGAKASGNRTSQQRVFCDTEEQAYTDILDGMRGDVGVIRRKLERALLAKQERAWIGGFETGRLDSRRFPAVLSGRSTVFKRKMDASDLDTAVTVLVDLSGSMSGSKMIAAAECAIALAEALERTSVSYEVLGFDNQSYAWTGERPSLKGFNRLEALYIHSYKAFEQRLITRRQAMASLRYADGGNNTDGEALEWVWSRLRKRGESRKVLLVLSDGYPAAATTDGDTQPFSRHLEKVVGQIAKEGCFVAGIGIQSDAVKKFYPVYAVVDNVSELGGEALTMIGRALLGQGSAVRAA